MLEEDEKCGKTWSEVTFWRVTDSNGDFKIIFYVRGKRMDIKLLTCIIIPKLRKRK